jgi:hypothetical protein
MCTAIVLLISVALANQALAAGADCAAFGRAYRDGQSFTPSTREYRDRRIYIVPMANGMSTKAVSGSGTAQCASQLAFLLGDCLNGCRTCLFAMVED